MLWSVLSDEINDGYQDLPPMVISSVNGRDFRDFKEFSTLVEKAVDTFTIFATNDNYKIILNHQNTMNSQPKILENYNITNNTHQRTLSPCFLREMWSDTN